MFGVCQGFAKILENDLGWYTGFVVHWPASCALNPTLLVGSNQIFACIHVSELPAPQAYHMVMDEAAVIVPAMEKRGSSQKNGRESSFGLALRLGLLLGGFLGLLSFGRLLGFH